MGTNDGISFPTDIAEPMPGAAAVREGTGVSIRKVLIERAEQPIGVDVAPRISWQLESDGRDVRSRSADIRVLRGDELIWRRTGAAPEPPEVECPLGTLAPDTAYRVELDIETDHGTASAISGFRTGLFDGDWSAARWIRAPHELAGPAPVLRAEFEVPETATSARLYLAAGGSAQVEINGTTAGDEVLGPGITAYDHRVQYLVWDVAELVRPGRNAISLELGRGFYAVAARNIWSWDTSPWTDEPCVMLRLVVDDAGGTHDVLISDERFRAIDGPTRYDDVYGGETFDARRVVTGASEPGFDDSGWPAAITADGPEGELVHRRQQPIRVIDTLPMKVLRQNADRILFDVGRVIAGWAALEVEGATGHRVEVRYSERLGDDGRPALDDPHGYYDGRFQVDELILSGRGVDRWESRFGWKGFRYVEVSGWPEGVDPDAVSARLVHTDVARTGSFVSSDPTLDSLHRIVVATLLNNLHSIPTDTPKYEKNAWTADGMLGTEMFLLNLDTHELLAKWVDDIADSRDASGAPRVIAPHGGWSYDWAPAPPWHSAYPLVTWWLHERGGDRRVVERHLDGILAYLELEFARSDGGIATSTLGDWMTPESDPAGSNPPEDVRVSATAFLAHMADIASRLAVAVGRPDDAARMGQLASIVGEAYRERFLDAENAVVRGADESAFRQGHNVLALAFGLVPAALEQRVADRIAADVRERGIHLNTGALSTKHLLPVLTTHGHAELALALARQRSYPSWGYWLDNGATTTWEHWSTESRSLDHYFLGTYDEWLYESVAGIEPLGVGYRHVGIRPRFLHEPASASAQVSTPYGPASVAWTSDGQVATLDIVVPVDCTAQLVLPCDDLSAVREGRLPLTDAAGIREVRLGPGRVTALLGSGRYRVRAVLGASLSTSGDDRLRREG